MAESLRKLTIDDGDIAPRNGDASELDDLLHPAQAFSHPSDVVNDPGLTLNEKRARQTASYPGGVARCWSATKPGQ